jgi:ribulose-phosphate 3-epimerase
MALIAPSILSADFSRLREDVAAAARGGARLLHVDIMDGHFVPNITIGPPVVRSLNAATELFLDCHLMIENPDALIPAFAKAGADSISVHVEAVRHLHRTIQLIRTSGARAGAVLNPATPLNSLDDILPELDYVLLMSVNPGFGGQKFLPAVLDKVRDLAEALRRRKLDAVIEVDGGVDETNARDLAEAGAGLLVAGTAVFGGGEPEAAARKLSGLVAAHGGEPSWVP